jgi:flagellar biosynthesis protein
MGMDKDADKKHDLDTKKPNPRGKAVALRYNPNIDNAPNIIAKGSGYIAEKILERAEDFDIPVYKDSSLVEELVKIDLGNNIPPELYQVVAQVLIFISDLDKINLMTQKA